MQTPARKRAETLFAEFTQLVDPVAKPAEATSDQPAPRASGPKTLHLPSGKGPAQTGWQVASLRRGAKAASAGSNSQFEAGDA